MTLTGSLVVETFVGICAPGRGGGGGGTLAQHRVYDNTTALGHMVRLNTISALFTLSPLPM